MVPRNHSFIYLWLPAGVAVMLLLALFFVLSVGIAAADHKSPTRESLSDENIVNTCPTELFFSEYIEGSSYNKALEIYNGTGIDLSLTGQYSVALYSNGNTTPYSKLTLNGIITANDVYVLAHTSAITDVRDKADLLTGGVTNFNGNDAVALYKDGVLIDILGTIGEISYWGSDVTLVRKDTITAGTSTFNIIEWDSYAQDTFNNLGDHTITGCSADSDLTVSKTGPEAAPAGENLVYTITIRNVNIDPASKVVVTDTLPSRTSYVSDNSGSMPSIPTPGVYAWDLGTIISGTEVSFNLTVTVDSNVSNGLVLTNTVNIATTATGDNQANNEVEHFATVYPLVSIHDIQYVVDPETDDVSPYKGKTVFVEGIVSAAPNELNTFRMIITNPAGGAWNGLYIYDDGNFGSLNLARGTEVRVLGEIAEYYGMTELMVGNADTDIIILSKDNPVPAAELVQTGDFIKADTAEQWESVLIEFQNAGVTDEDIGNGEWAIDDGSGTTVVDDLGSVMYSPALGDVYDSIKGIGWYSFDRYKLTPRDDNDIVLPATVHITKDAEPNVIAGKWLTYTITVRNETGKELNDIAIVDFVPEMTTLVAVLDGGDLISGNKLTWEIPSLADHAILNVSFVVEVLDYPGQIIVNENYYMEAANWDDQIYGTPIWSYIGPYTPIPEIQGSDFRSSYESHLVKTRGKVVGFFQGNSSEFGYFDGVFIQDPIGDGDKSTSDAVFVNYKKLDIISLGIGDMVEVTGVVNEFSEWYGDACEGVECLTQVAVQDTADIITITSGLKTQQSIIPITLNPPGDPASSNVYYEALEGMLVTLSDDGIVIGPTSYGAVHIIREDLGVNRVMRGGPYEGMPVALRNWELFGDINGNDAPNLIVSSTVTNVDGPLIFSYDDYMIITQENDEWQTATAAPLPGAVPSWPDAGVDEFTVATFNTYNFDSNNSTSKQKKVVDSIAQLNGPAFVALQEIEGHDADFMADLLANLALVGYDYNYAYSLPDDGGHGIALFWNTAKVTDITWSTAYQACSPYGNPFADYDPLWDTCLAQDEYPTFSRRPVVVTGTIQLDSGNQPIVVIANHFKSKSGSNPADDMRRLEQGTFINELVAGFIANGSENIIVMGDLNDFEDSATLNTMYTNGILTNTWFTYDSDRYTYIYEGVSQVLDHILVSPVMQKWLRSMGPLHFNADYPFKPYANDGNVVWRTSDHDLVAATLALPDLIADFTSNSPILIGETAIFTHLTVGPEPISYEWDFGDGTASVVDQDPTHFYTSPGTYTVTLIVTNPFEMVKIAHEFIVKPVRIYFPQIPIP